MTISSAAESLGLTLVTNPGYEDRDITGCYIGDLLSLVMGKATDGDVWITIQTNINIVAVAALTEAACVVIPEGISVEPTTVDKANEKGIIIFGSEKDSYNLAVALSKLI